LLGSLGCDEVQGYLFSPPVSEEEMTEILKEGTRLFTKKDY